MAAAALHLASALVAELNVMIRRDTVALLAIATDLFFTVGERWVLPAGTRAKDRTEVEAAPKI